MHCFVCLPPSLAITKAYNAETKKGLVATWQALFHRMFAGLEPTAKEPRLQIQNFDEAIKAKYGARVSGACVGDTHAGLPPEPR